MDNNDAVCATKALSVKLLDEERPILAKTESIETILRYSSFSSFTCTIFYYSFHLFANIALSWLARRDVSWLARQNKKPPC